MIHHEAHDTHYMLGLHLNANDAWWDMKGVLMMHHEHSGYYLDRSCNNTTERGGLWEMLQDLSYVPLVNKFLSWLASLPANWLVCWLRSPIRFGFHVVAKLLWMSLSCWSWHFVSEDEELSVFVIDNHNFPCIFQNIFHGDIEFLWFPLISSDSLHWF